MQARNDAADLTAPLTRSRIDYDPDREARDDDGCLAHDDAGNHAGAHADNGASVADDAHQHADGGTHREADYAAPPDGDAAAHAGADLSSDNDAHQASVGPVILLGLLTPTSGELAAERQRDPGDARVADFSSLRMPARLHSSSNRTPARRS